MGSVHADDDGGDIAFVFQEMSDGKGCGFVEKQHRPNSIRHARQTGRKGKAQRVDLPGWPGEHKLLSLLTGTAKYGGAMEKLRAPKSRRRVQALKDLIVEGQDGVWRKVDAVIDCVGARQKGTPYNHQKQGGPAI